MQKSKAVFVVAKRRQARQQYARGWAATWLVTPSIAFLLITAPPLYSFGQSARATALEAAEATPTSTELSVSTDGSNLRTHAHFIVRVDEARGLADQKEGAVGIVTLSNERGAIGSAPLDSDGTATFDIDGLPSGSNQIVATYSGTTASSGNPALGASTSRAVLVNALDSGIPGFTLALAPAALTVKAGTDGTLLATITPTNGFNQLVSISCAGKGVPLPPGVSCLFTPTNLVPAGSAPLTSSLSIQTLGVAGKVASASDTGRPDTQRSDTLDWRSRGGIPGGSTPLYSVVLPGLLALLGLGVARKRALAPAPAPCRQPPGKRSAAGSGRTLPLRLSLLALLLVSAAGLSSCAARYHYLHNPPAANYGTPLGTYTIVVTASSSSNSSIIVQSQNIVLTVD